MNRIQKILLTTDFSPCARLGYGPAVEMARKFKAGLDLVRCVDYPYSYAFAGLELTGKGEQSFRDYLAARLEEEARDPIFEGLPLEHHLLQAHGGEAVAAHAASWGADLIVQASHGYRGFRRFLLGSFAESVLRTARLPTLTVKGDPTDPPSGAFAPKRILLAHDLTASAAGATASARALAGAYGAQVLVAHAWRDVPELVPPPGLGGEGMLTEFLAACEVLPDRLEAELRSLTVDSFPGLVASSEVLRGDPAAAIVERAQGFSADLICLGACRSSRLERFLLGSTALKVARNASIPVLTVPA